MPWGNLVFELRSLPLRSEGSILNRVTGAVLSCAFFAAVLAGEGDAASRLGSRTEGPGDGMGTSRLFPPFESCQPGGSAGVRTETCTCVPSPCVIPLPLLRFSSADVDHDR